MRAAAFRKRLLYNKIREDIVMSEDKNYSILNLDGASDVIIKMLVMIENAVGWIGAPKGAKKDFNEGLAIYKESIEKNDTLSGLEKGAKISNARMELKQYINQGKIISNAFKNLQNEAKMNVEDDWLLVFLNMQRIFRMMKYNKYGEEFYLNNLMVTLVSVEGYFILYHYWIKIQHWILENYLVLHSDFLMILLNKM